ncbi:MAG: putative signal transduction response regulator, receiver domain protein [Nitrososphaeraceae archaeon]|jgi:two-component system CheB/CheR fusion protein|nr:putative signal transduction response regulator, receiver domain protein [Nitrososphaeraceae archaeon]
MHGDGLGQTTKIMIIEDDEDILLLYKDYLKKKGHIITVSSTTANEAVRDYDSYKPDLVIADFKLPGRKNGLQAASEILSKHSRAKILIITAFEHVREEMVEKGFPRKNVIILLKPVRLSHLGQIISRLSNDKQNPV